MEERSKYALLCMEIEILQDKNISQIENLMRQNTNIETYVFRNENEKTFTRNDLLRHGYKIIEIF